MIILLMMRQFQKEVEQKTQLQLQKLEPLTNQEVHDYLATFDPQSAKDIHPNNRKRVLRAIEYYLNTKTYKFSQESTTIYRKL